MPQYFPFFYHAQMRKYVAVFGSLFNEIQVGRYDPNGNLLDVRFVPLAYGPRDPALARQDEEPDFNERKAAVFLPRMTFELTSLNYDPARKLPRQNYVLDKENGQAILVPAPWVLMLDLVIGTTTIDEGNQIVEQILPMFNSEITTRVEIIPGVEIDVPIILEGISKEDNWAQQMGGRREIKWTLNFSMKVHFFGPLRPRKVIKFIQTTTHVDTLTDMTSGESVEVYPGLDATGEGTTNPANAIDWSLVEAGDPWNFIVEIKDAD